MGLNTISETWRLFTAVERRNIAVYILGIVVYKFGLEAFNGSVIALATNRYDYDALTSQTPAKTFERIGLLTGLNQGFQVVGSILIAPLIKRYRIKNVLSGAILVFAIFSAVLLIVDGATGGLFLPAAYRGVGKHPKNQYWYYGKFDTDGIIPIYSICGIAFGMVELIRRVIPRDIVGGNVKKLRTMDSLVHVFNELSGTAAAFCSALGLIPTLGNNKAFLITPPCFAICSILFYTLADSGLPSKTSESGGALGRTSFLKALSNSVVVFFESIYVGGKILFSSRKFLWLLPAYTIALYGHRYLESGIVPPVARRYLGESSWSQIIIGGSNLGELIGALFVLFSYDLVPTPIPWLRLDALTLLAIWYLPYWRPPAGDVSQAWIAAATVLPISMCWSAGDVSLIAYIQALLTRIESQEERVSTLGALMAFLYSVNIILMAVASPLLGRYIDKVYTRTGGANGGNIYEAIRNVGGVQFTVIAVIVFASTLVPKGSWALNPTLLYNEQYDQDLSDEEALPTASPGGEVVSDEKATASISVTQQHAV
ncbi:hypothetical protein OQA88_5467 [Cercophora sp. LCS_1]